MTPPVLYVLAGPNGAGKSTLYESRVRHMTSAEFVNPDLLASARFGHPARTEAESVWGQAEAERRREQLMDERASVVIESTFSHPSKLDFLQRAKQLGYVLVVFHVNVEAPEDAVHRVTHRVATGGHPVPEDRIRTRYARNQPLIRQAMLAADRGFILDNSRISQPPILLAEFANGIGQRRHDPLPAWAATLYGADLPPP